MDYIAKKIGITQAKDIRIERIKEILDKYPASEPRHKRK